LCFTCASLVCFAGIIPASAQDASRIESLIKQEIVRRTPSLEKARIEISFKNLKDLSGSAGKDYKLAYPDNMSLAGDAVIPVDVYMNADFMQRVNLRTSIKIFERVAVSTSRIRRGDLFSLKNIGYAERDTTHLPSNYITNTNKALGRQSSTFVPKGALILDWMPKESPAVRKGETVDLFKRTNGVFAKVRAVAVEDGYINGNIRVRNISSNKVIEGRVVSSGEVEAI